MLEGCTRKELAQLRRCSAGMLTGPLRDLERGHAGLATGWWPTKEIEVLQGGGPSKGGFSLRNSWGSCKERV